MIEAIIFTAVTFAVTVFVVNNIILRGKLLHKNVENTKLKLDKTQLQEEILVDKVTDMEGFVKFLSESRDSAFEYIEQVQEAIVKLKEAMDKDDENKITTAYENLIAFLPDETKND